MEGNNNSRQNIIVHVINQLSIINIFIIIVFVFKDVMRCGYFSILYGRNIW